MFSDNQQVSGFSGDVSEYAQIEAAYGGLEGGQNSAAGIQESPTNGRVKIQGAASAGLLPSPGYSRV